MSANNRLKKAIINQDLDGVKAALADGANSNRSIYHGSSVSGAIISGAASCGIGLVLPGNTFIGLALQKGTPDILEELINNGADPNERIDISKDGSKFFGSVTPLLYVISNNQADFLRVLLKNNKTDPLKTAALKGIKEVEPLEYAREKDNYKIIRMLEAYIPRYLDYKKQEKIEKLQKSNEEKLAELGLNASDMTNPSETTYKTPLDIKKFAREWNPVKAEISKIKI